MEIKGQEKSSPSLGLSSELSGEQSKFEHESQSLVHPKEQNLFFSTAKRIAQSSTSLQDLPAVALMQGNDYLSKIASAHNALVPGGLAPALYLSGGINNKLKDLRDSPKAAKISGRVTAANSMEESAVDALKGDTGAELKALPEISSSLAQRIFENAPANQVGDAYFATAGKEIAAKHEMLQAFAIVDVTGRGPAKPIELLTAQGLTPALDERALGDLQIRPILENALKGINMQEKIPLTLALGKEELSAELGISLLREELPQSFLSKLAGIFARIGRSAIRAAL